MLLWFKLQYFICYFGLRCNTSYVVLCSPCICLSLKNSAITSKLVMKMVNIQGLSNNNFITLTILSFVLFYHGGHDFPLKM
jgi:hypothetical protein